jgi:DNA repair protein RecO (recombination protein O)
MPLLSDRCICLRKTPYSETSQILLLLCRDHGLIRAIAKGAHRRTKAGASKFDGGVDLLDIGQAVFTFDPSRELSILTEWSLHETPAGLRRDLRAMYLGLYAAELFPALIEEHDPHPELFERMEDLLEELGSPRTEEAFLAFMLDLLRGAGYLAELSNCISCQRALQDQEAAYFSMAQGGVVCRQCEAAFPDRVEVDLRLLRLAQGILRLPRQNGSPRRLPRLTRHQTDPLNRLLAEHIQHTLGKRLRLARYILP